MTIKLLANDVRVNVIQVIKPLLTVQ